jgi:hypothetical protein
MTDLSTVNFSDEFRRRQTAEHLASLLTDRLDKLGLFDTVTEAGEARAKQEIISTILDYLTSESPPAS